MLLSPKIFKAYDVRGLYPQEFDAEGSWRVARAFVQYLSESKKGPLTFVLGRDARPSSEPIAQAVSSAFVESGATVLDIGLSTTPLFYFAINHFGASGGIMVTASHNPPQFNGLKLCREEAIAIGAGSGIEEIRDLALSEEVFPRLKGNLRNEDALTPYVAFLRSKATLSRPLTVIIDPGNGMTGIVLERLLPLFSKLTVHRLHFEVDGTFPNHIANPLDEETLRDIKEELRRTPADLGIAFDGDGDRVGFLTSEGLHVRGDIITALLAQQVLASSEKVARVLFDVRSSRVVAETIDLAGGAFEVTVSGHANINRAMRERNAVLAGELSGHYYFRDFFFRDDAMLAALRILQMVSEGRALHEMAAPLQKYAQSGELNFRIADKAAALERVESAFRDGRVSKIDGLTIEYDDWWFNLRASNTEDLLRLNVEADTPQVLKKKLSVLEKLIDK